MRSQGRLPLSLCNSSSSSAFDCELLKLGHIEFSVISRVHLVENLLTGGLIVSVWHIFCHGLLRAHCAISCRLPIRRSISRLVSRVIARVLLGVVFLVIVTCERLRLLVVSLVIIRHFL